MKKTILLTILCFAASTTHAQFFKKLGKKAEKAAERAVERRVEQKASKETDKALDKTIDRGENKKKKGAIMPGLSGAEPAAKYTFDNRAEIRFTSGKDEMNTYYYLPKSGNFLGMLIIDEKIQDDFISVLDIDRNAMYTYMENKGQKMRMGVSFNTTSASEEAINEASITINATGESKTILGYNCLEYKMTGPDMTATIWVTKDTDIRFPSTFHSIEQPKKKNQNQAWMKDIDGWAMEMVMIDSSRKKPVTITMTCLSISDSKLEINSNEYQKMGY